jgi:parallel beta-helix repeat protein
MANPFLTKVQLTTYDSSQAPTGATVTFYQPGTTVTNDTVLPAHSVQQPVPVNDTSTLTVGDQVTLGVDGPTRPIVAITSPTGIKMDNPGSTAITLTTGMRLLRAAAAPPRLYSSRGGVPISGNVITTTVPTGRGAVFVEADRFDYIVTVPGEPKRVVADVYGGRFQSEFDWNDVSNFPSIQAAIDALPAAGGVVYIPSGNYRLTAGLVITKDSVTLKGAGPGTYIRPQVFNQYDLITVTAGRCRISDLKLDGYSGGAGDKSCLAILGPAASCHLENLQVTGGKYGLWLRDAKNTLVVNCEFTSNSEGVHLDRSNSSSVGVNGARFLNCILTQNGRGAVAYYATGLTFYGCDFEGNGGGSGSAEGNAVEAHHCNQIEVYSCYLEDAAPGSAQFILLDACPSAVVDSCWFQGNANPPSYAVRFNGSPWSRLSNNANSYKTDPPVPDPHGKLAFFDSTSNDSVEFGNRDASAAATLPELIMEGSVRVLGLSRKALGLYTCVDDAARPPDDSVREGSMVWVSNPSGTNSKLQVYGTIGTVKKWWNTTLT